MVAMTGTATGTAAKAGWGTPAKTSVIAKVRSSPSLGSSAIVIVSSFGEES